MSILSVFWFAGPFFSLGDNGDVGGFGVSMVRLITEVMVSLSIWNNILRALLHLNNAPSSDTNNLVVRQKCSVDMKFQFLQAYL